MKKDWFSRFGRFHNPRSLRLPGDLKGPCHKWDDDADQVYCPELNEEIPWTRCLSCENYQVWNQKDGVRICRYEYEDLKSRGYYDGTWDEHPENFDPEEWERLQEERENAERVRRELEEDWERLESKREKMRKMLKKMNSSMYPDSEEDEEDEETFD